MLIHSVVPTELLMEQPPASGRSCRCCASGYLELSPAPDGRMLVSRLISTDPAAYLDPSNCPGSEPADRPAGRTLFY